MKIYFQCSTIGFITGELQTPVITVSPDTTKGAYGWCTAYKAWSKGEPKKITELTKEAVEAAKKGDGFYEINICAEHLSRPFEQICETLLHEMVPGYFFEDIDFMGEGLSDLGFIMDCGESVKRVFPGVNVFGDNEVLQRIINEFDIQLLGNAIYSQWRYFNHWAMAPMNEDDYQWFVIALSRLAELCE